MISETLLRALQERMRKLTDASSKYAVRDVELRAAVERARLTDGPKRRRRPPPSGKANDWPMKSATLACMHGSAWRGDGAALLRNLADVLTR